MRLPFSVSSAIAVFLSYSAAVHAGGSAEASARAVEHSMQALGYSIEGGLKLVSGAAALPLITAGEVGKVSGEAGHYLWDEANSPPHGAFPVTDEIVTVGPEPDKQLQGEQASDGE